MNYLKQIINQKKIILIIIFTLLLFIVGYLIFRKTRAVENCHALWELVMNPKNQKFTSNKKEDFDFIIKNNINKLNCSVIDIENIDIKNITIYERTAAEGFDKAAYKVSLECEGVKYKTNFLTKENQYFNLYTTLGDCVPQNNIYSNIDRSIYQIQLYK